MIGNVEVIHKYKQKKEVNQMETFGILEIKDFAKMIGRGKSTIYDWKNNGTLPANCFKQVGGIWYVKIKEVQAFMAA